MVRRIFAVIAAAALAGGTPTGSAEPVSTTPMPVGTPKTLTILTYNVQDLPWPLVTDRASAFTRMAARLRALQRSGEAPDIIVVQEGFTSGTAAMLRAAGYVHMVSGSSAVMPRPRPAVPLSPQFLAEQSVMTGEKMAPRLSSGLWIASRYPILDAVAQPFPQGACAGVDCLANKGMLLARIAVPGLSRPVDVVTSHFNAARKSRTAPRHHLYAYRQQVAAMVRFIRSNGQPEALAAMAGDFNLGSSELRLDAFTRGMRATGFSAVTAMGKAKDEGDCGRVGPCAGALPISPNVPLIHSLDWQVVRPARDARLVPVERRQVFGLEPDGTMLSDHIGYSVRYRIEALAPRRQGFARRMPMRPTGSLSSPGNR